MEQRKTQMPWEITKQRCSNQRFKWRKIESFEKQVLKLSINETFLLDQTFGIATSEDIDSNLMDFLDSMNLSNMAASL